MATTVTFNGSSYSIPASGETGWASLSNYLIAVANNAQTTSNFKHNIRVSTGTTDAWVTATDFCIASNHSAPQALTLPAGVNGQIFACVDVSSAGASVNNITVSGSGGQQINGSSSFVINKDKVCVFFQFSSTLSAWRVLSIGYPNLTFPNSGTVATLAGTETFTNKTLTSPVINSPTGIVKADVGLGNVDNTSDATKNAAVATLTNKTLTSPVINTPTGIVKGDVGLGNVDNTSDATKNAASVVLTNKDFDGGTASNTSRITLPKETTTNLNALTRKVGTIVWNTSLAAAQVDNGVSLETLTTATLSVATFGSVPNSGGASASGNTITLQPADASNPGGVSTASQTFAGRKSAGNSKFLAYRTSAQTIASATEVKVQFNVEGFDTNTEYDNATNFRFTPTRAGKYLVGSIVSVSNQDDASQYQLYIKKNGTTVVGKYEAYHAKTGNGGIHEGCVTTFVDMNGSTDYLEVYVVQNSGSRSTGDNQGDCQFWGYEVV